MNNQEIIESNKFICTYCGIDPIKDFCKNPKECYTKKKVEFTIEEPSAISAEEIELAESIIKKRYPFCDSNIDGKDIEINGKIAIELMQEYANASMRNNQWISVDERLPTIEENGEKVLIYRATTESQKLLATSIHDTLMVKYCESGTLWTNIPKLP